MQQSGHWPRARFGLLGIVVTAFLGAGRPEASEAGGWSHRALLACNGGTTAITPCGTSADTLVATAVGQRSFTISNSAATDKTYNLSCAATVPIESCTVTPSVLVVPAGGSAGTAVTYTATATIASGGAITVAADGGGLDQVATTIVVGTVAASATSP